MTKTQRAAFRACAKIADRVAARKKRDGDAAAARHGIVIVHGAGEQIARQIARRIRKRARA